MTHNCDDQQEQWSVYYINESSNHDRNRTVKFARPVVTDVKTMDPRRLEESPIESSFPSSVTYSSPIIAGSHQFNSPAVCRICYSGEKSGPKDGEPLISPCHCKGTMGLYHRSCLSRWLVTSNKPSCEICRFKFDIQQVKRPFWDFLKDEDAQSARKNMLMDILCFVILSPLVLLSSSICIYSGIRMIFYHLEEGYEEPRLEIGAGLIILSLVLVIAYSVWLLVTLIFHRRAFRYWQHTHMDLQVVDQLSLEESILINGL